MQQHDSTLEDAFKKRQAPCASRPHRCGELVVLQVSGPVCVGFVKLPSSHVEWLNRKHGAFEIDREELGLCSKGHTSHHETWIHLVDGGTPERERERRQDPSRQGGENARCTHRTGDRSPPPLRFRGHHMKGFVETGCDSKNRASSFLLCPSV